MKRPSTDSEAPEDRASNSEKNSSKYKPQIRKHHHHTEGSHKRTRFPVFPQSTYDAPFPYFAAPSEFGTFSLDGTVSGERNVYNDSRKLKNYTPPRDVSRVNFDLRQGYDLFLKKDDDIKDRLDNLLHWILKNRQKFSQNDSGMMESLNTDFLMWRGHLTKIICTPFISDSWAMAVTLFRGTWYMSEVETLDNARRRKGMDERQEEMCYWGYKFEQYLTSEEEHGTPDTSVPVDSHDAFCTVVRSSLSKHRLLYSGEVDCIRADSPHKPPGNYVELKTSREWSNERQRRNFSRFKLIKWWAQSFLVGIPEVICGFRDDNGIVKRLDTFNTMKMHKEPFVDWNGAIAFNFCEKFLSFVKEVVTEDDPSKVYLFERAPNSDHVSWRVLDQPSDVFLPEWYTSQFIPG